MSSAERLTIKQVDKDFPVEQFDHPAWKGATPIRVNTYWSGENAPSKRTFRVELLWSVNALYVRFEANQYEPLVVSEKPDLSKKVRGLWERDVCEIFIAPDKKNPNKYYEFEIAPTGEWIDLGIEVTPEGRKTDWDYTSGMTSAARIEKDKVIMAIRIPWEAFGSKPKPRDVWLGNIFRCVGKDPDRGYLAWRPTKTAKPNFHVPEAFGEFQFVSESAP